MRVKILKDNTYSKFGKDSIEAEKLKEGDERDNWPDWYALDCKASGFVEILSAPATEPIEVVDLSTVKTLVAEDPQDGVERYKDAEPELAANVTDSAARLAKGFGVDLSKVTGTGKDGKITVNDVKAVIAAVKETTVGDEG